MLTSAFAQFAGVSGIIAGISSIAYAVTLLILKDTLLAMGILALGAFFSVPIIVALSTVLSTSDRAFAVLGLVLGVIGALGAVVHAVTNVADLLTPGYTAPATPSASPIDPRGFLSFGVTGLGIFIFAWLISRSTAVPRILAPLGYVLAVLLVALFLGNLLVTQTTSLAILVPGGLASLIVDPLWLISLGVIMFRRA